MSACGYKRAQDLQSHVWCTFPTPILVAAAYATGCVVTLSSVDNLDPKYTVLPIASGTYVMRPGQCVSTYCAYVGLLPSKLNDVPFGLPCTTCSTTFFLIRSGPDSDET